MVFVSEMETTKHTKYTKEGLPARSQADRQGEFSTLLLLPSRCFCLSFVSFVCFVAGNLCADVTVAVWWTCWWEARSWRTAPWPGRDAGRDTRRGRQRTSPSGRRTAPPRAAPR